MARDNFLFGYKRNDQDRITAKMMRRSQLTAFPNNPKEDWWDSPDKVPHIDGRINPRHPDVLNGKVIAQSADPEIQALRDQVKQLQELVASTVAAVHEDVSTAPRRK
jgi:hypothetical protein